MGADNRDWYRDWWRRKTGYVERASFRVSEGELARLRHRRAWRGIWFRAFLLVALAVLAVLVRRLI